MIDFAISTRTYSPKVQSLNQHIQNNPTIIKITTIATIILTLGMILALIFTGPSLPIVAISGLAILPPLGLALSICMVRITIEKQLPLFLSDFLAACFPPPLPSDKEIIYGLREELSQLDSFIMNFDKFIRNDPELFAICVRIIQKHGDAISPCPPIPSHITDERSLLVIQCGNYRHRIQERILFVNRHKEVAECFQRALQRSAEGRLINRALLTIKDL